MEVDYILKNYGDEIAWWVIMDNKILCGPRLHGMCDGDI